MAARTKVGCLLDEACGGVALLGRTCVTHICVSVLAVCLLQAPLDASLEGQELMQLVINHLNAAQSTSPLPAGTNITSPSRPASGHPGRLMLRPVAMPGCLHMLLPVCLAPDGPLAADTAAAAAVGRRPRGCVFDEPHTEFLQQLSAGGRAYSEKYTARGAAQHSIQLYLQIDEGEPQLVVKKAEGTWSLGDSVADISASSSNTAGSRPSTAFDSKGCSKGCWLEPSCVLLHQAGNAFPSPSSPGAAGSSDRPLVLVKGLPAAAGTLVRVLLVQGAAVVADQLLPATPSNEQDDHCVVGTRVVR